MNYENNCERYDLAATIVLGKPVINFAYNVDRDFFYWHDVDAGEVETAFGNDERMPIITGVASHLYDAYIIGKSHSTLKVGEKDE